MKLGAAMGGGMLLPLGMADRVFGFSLAGQALAANPLAVPKYVDQLPVAELTQGAGVFSPTGSAGGTDLYNVGIYQFKAQVHSAIAPGAGTTVWSYRPQGWTAPATPQNCFLGPSFAIQRGKPTEVTWNNNLTGISHPMPVDPALHWADPLKDDLTALTPPAVKNPAAAHGYDFPVDPITGLSTFNYTLNTVPIVPHVHGGEQGGYSDGGPDAWWTPGFAQTGPSYKYAGLRKGDPNSTAAANVYPYDNTQQAATIWYHDHALGITRLNVYMGMAGAYLIYDPAFEAPLGLPWLFDGKTDKFGNPYDIPLVIQDRMFDVNGQLYYPAIADNPTATPFWVPEFFGDHILVNGKVWPNLNVEPRKYRFRVLNGSNARFYELYLWDELAQMVGPKFVQIAVDGSYLGRPATIDSALGQKLIVGPGERAEIVIDFSAFAGRKLIMRNTGRSPWPGGAVVHPQTTRQVMQFAVDPEPVTDTSVVPVTINPQFNTAAGAPKYPSINVAAGTDPIVKVRSLTLNEWMGPLGPFMATLNNTMWPHHGAMPGMHDSETEFPKLGTTEVWELINLTGDAHPIHTHLVQFQLLSRQRFNFNKYWKAYVAAFGGMDPSMMRPMGPPADYNSFAASTHYAGATGVTPYTRALSLNAAGAPIAGLPVVGGNPNIAPFLQGPVMWAPPEERGWKDTVRMLPGEVTRFLIRFKPNDDSAAFPFDATAQPGYVWHCHILDHEDNEMMRPYHVKP